MKYSYFSLSDESEYYDNDPSNLFLKKSKTMFTNNKNDKCINEFKIKRENTHKNPQTVNNFI